MPDSPLVTVVIPTRNRWPVLRRTLENVRRQEGVELEVIVVDDASSEPQPADLVGGDLEGFVRVLRQAGSYGVAAARNRGIAEARGAWIALLDDDDVWSPGKLALQLAALERNGADFAYCEAVTVTPALEVLTLLSAPRPDRLLEALLSSSAIPAGASNVVASTEVLRRLGGFDEQFGQLADWDLWLRLAHTGRPSVVDEPLVGYVQHPANMLALDHRDVLDEFDRLQRKHASLEQELGLSFAGATVAHWAGAKYVAARQPARAARTAVRGAVRFRAPWLALWALTVPARTVNGRVRAPGARTLEPAWLRDLRLG